MKFIISVLCILCFQFIAISQTQTTTNKNWAKKIETPYLNNLHKVNDSLYRCEQPDLEGYKLLNKMKIKSVLSLYPNSDDDKLTEKFYFKTYSVKMYSDDFSNKDIAKALYIIKVSPKPLLIHCKHGADRTGLVFAMYRIIFEHWTKRQAIDEMKLGGFGFKSKKYKNIVEYIHDVDLDKIIEKIKELE